jgi:hypothetical protein
LILSRASESRLHFYVIDVHKDDRGVRTYQVGVKSLDGSGPQVRGISLAPGSWRPSADSYALCDFTLTNTGHEAATSPPKDADAENLAYDIYRMAARVDGQGWSARLQSGLTAVKFGESAPVEVYLARASGNASSAVVTLTVKSVSDLSKIATATCSVSQ